MGNATIQGELWGQMPQEWASVQEPHNQPLWEVMLDGVLVGAGTRFLDVGCGGGGASVLAAARGASVSGLDAAEPLLEIARQRVPNGDIRQGDMEALPFADGAFDAVFAANCIQFPANRETAVSELARVCAKNGRIVAGLFGPPDKVTLNVVTKAIVAALPNSPSGPNPFDLAMPGMLEALFETAGLNVVQSGSVQAPFHYPDFETCYRGFLSAGPIQMTKKVIGEAKLREAIYEGTRPFSQDDGTILIEPNVFIYVVATP